MVHDQTTQLCREMVARGDLDTLSRERVFKELEKALSAPHPSEFFAVLASVNALTLIFQGVELAKTKNLDGPATNTPPASRFSQLVLENPALDLQGLNKQLAIPKAWLELATMTRTWAEAFCQVTTLAADAILAALERGDARRKPMRFAQSVHISCQSLIIDSAEQAAILGTWQRLVQETAKVTLPKTASGLAGQDIKAMIRAEQLRRIEATCDRN
jgi:tRNA nucleotidyltransferase (CCA-adding enzyme)